MKKALRLRSGEKGFIAPVLILIGVLIVAALVAGAFWFGKNYSSKSANLTPSPSPSPAVSLKPETPDKTADFKAFISTEGKYSFKYPISVKLYENEKFSADGVKIPLKDTIVLVSEPLPGINSNYQLSINHKVTNATSLKDFVDKNSSCQSVESANGKAITLGGKQALIFEDAPCGPNGETVILSLNGQMGYIIEIETSTSYSEIKSFTDQILSTFKFAQ